MPYFAVQYRYDPNADVDAVRPRHREYLREQAAAGRLKASGPYLAAARYSALLIFQATDAAEVQEIIAADPMSTSGVLAESVVLAWNPVIGVFAD